MAKNYYTILSKIRRAFLTMEDFKDLKTSNLDIKIP